MEWRFIPKAPLGLGLLGEIHWTNKVQDNEDDDPTYGDDTDLRQRTNKQAMLFKHFWTRWQKEYLTALREFHPGSRSW